MMIVMFLIALITGVVAYNYRASLEEGRAFKTHEGIERIRTILLLELAENPNANIEGGWQNLVRNSPLAGRSESMLRDGWGTEYRVIIHEEGGERDIEVQSNAFDRYRERNPGKFQN
jgi:hypothetical protein